MNVVIISSPHETLFGFRQKLYGNVSHSPITGFHMRTLTDPLTLLPLACESSSSALCACSLRGITFYRIRFGLQSKNQLPTRCLLRQAGEL